MTEQGVFVPDKAMINVMQTRVDTTNVDALFIDRAALAANFSYVGFWFACDRSVETNITVDFYHAPGGEPRPEKQSEEILENSFKKSPRFALSPEHQSIWVTCRVGTTSYCSMKLFPPVAEASFINYKVINHRGSTYDTLKTGVIKGDQAVFYKIGIEDHTGEIDYNDTIFFLVCVKSLPPADWKFDPNLFGVRKLPVVINSFLFSAKGTYSRWLGQDPLSGS